METERRGGEPKRARLGQPLGLRPAGLAPRMLGHVGEASRRGVRHPRRRHRPRLPAPRERSGAIDLRVRHQAHGQCLGAQRPSPGRGREDVEKPRQFRHHPRRDRGLARLCLAGRGGAVLHVAHAIPAAHGLDLRRPRRGAQDAVGVVRVFGGRAAGAAKFQRPCSRRLPTT